MAYRTLNMLYQAIIDNSIQRRKKEDFELQAKQLPIVDRFNRTKPRGKLIEDTFCMERSMMNGNRKKTTAAVGSTGRPEPITKYTRFENFRVNGKRQERKVVPEEYQINPWDVQEGFADL